MDLRQKPLKPELELNYREMRKQIIYWIVIGIAFSFSSCELYVEVVSNDSTEQIVYDINEPLSILTLIDDMDLELIVSDDNTLIINGAKDVLDNFILEYETGELSIKYKKGKSWMYDKPQAQLRVPKICDINLFADNDVFSNDTIRTEDFEISSEGTGDINLMVNCKNLICNANYTCNFYISGSTNKLKVNTTFGSIFHGENLVADHILCENGGSNHQFVHPVKSLKCDMLLNGNVYYVSEPDELIVNIINDATGKVIYNSTY